MQLISVSPTGTQAKKSNAVKYQMIQNLPPSVVMKKNKKLAAPAASAYVSPASSLSKGFHLGSADSNKDGAASNSVNRKNLISKPIVPPHLKTHASKYPISANVSPKDSFSLMKNKTKGFQANKKPQKSSNQPGLQTALPSHRGSKLQVGQQNNPLVINLHADQADNESQGMRSSSFNSKYQSFKQFQNPKNGGYTQSNTLKNSMNSSQIGTAIQQSVVGVSVRAQGEPVLNIDSLLNKNLSKITLQTNELSMRGSNQHSLLRKAKENVKHLKEQEYPLSSPSILVPNEFGGQDGNGGTPTVALDLLDDPEEDDDAELAVETERNLGIGGPRAQMKSHTITLNLKSTPSKLDSRKVSINDLPKMSILNLNRIQRQQGKTEQTSHRAGGIQNGSSNSQTTGNGMKLSVSKMSQLGYIRQHGITPGVREDGGSESGAAQANSSGLIANMAIVRKPFLSKTAQVSAYASKNNSNNSSQVRGPSGAPSQAPSTKQMQEYELGTALKALKQPRATDSQGGIAPNSSSTSVFAANNRYKSGFTSGQSSNNASRLRIKGNLNSRDNSNVADSNLDQNSRLIGGPSQENRLGIPRQIGNISGQESQPSLKSKVRETANRAMKNQGIALAAPPKKQINNYSSLINSVLSTKSKLNHTGEAFGSQVHAGSLVASSRANFAASILGGNTSQGSHPQMGASQQPTLKSKVKQQMLQDRQQKTYIPEEHARGNMTPSGLRIPVQTHSLGGNHSPHEESRDQLRQTSNTVQFQEMQFYPQAELRDLGPEPPLAQTVAQIMPKKKHGQPSQGSAQKKGTNRVGQTPVNGDMTPQQHPPGSHMAPHDHNSALDPEQNRIQANQRWQGGNNSHSGQIQHELVIDNQPSINPQVSFCEQIDELHETESQQEKPYQISQKPSGNQRGPNIATVFNIRSDLQAQIGLRKPQQKLLKAGSKSIKISPAASKRTSKLSFRQLQQESEMAHHGKYSQVVLPKQVAGVPQHKQHLGMNTVEQNCKDANSHRSISLENLSENSQQQQLREYYKDIQKLKKMIRLYFQEYHVMKSSTCEFYRIGRVLGRGAFGKVNLACHKVCEHLVAIKSIERKVLRNEKEQKRRVMQEMTILKQSGHDNVVRLYDTFETPRHICFVMELCQGGDLLTYVRKRRKLKEDNAKFLFKQLIEGLNYIHSKKFVVHRDIKLDNILLDQSGRIKICDFGVSKQVNSEAERMHDQCGTPAYIAPEIIKGRGYRGFKADMWSAGICLFVMLVGTVPFRASTMEQLHELIKNSKFDLSGEKLSPEAKDLLAKLIETEPRKRLSAAQTLQHPWLLRTADGQHGIDVHRPDLADVIFTEKEKQTIEKDYLCRLEKIKQKRFKKEEKKKQPLMYAKAALNQSSRATDGDFIFTEHHLDTREDEGIDRKSGAHQSIQSFFNKKQSECDNSFTKLVGFDVKPKAQIENQNSLRHEPLDKTNLKNVSEQSIIYAPFNSSQSDFDEERPELFKWPQEIITQLQPKKSKIMKFSKRCRDLNREYESNNNADLDNGVYNAFVNEQEAEAEQQQLLQHQEFLKNQKGKQVPAGQFNNLSNSFNRFGKKDQSLPVKGDEEPEDLEDINDATNLSSDDEHALASIKKLELRAQHQDASVLTEAKELSIHESMQKMHEYNHQDHSDHNSDICFSNINTPSTNTQDLDSKIDGIIVKYTADLFIEQDINRKSDSVIKEFIHSPPKKSKFESFNQKTKVNNLFEKHSPKKQKNAQVIERQEYQMNGGSDLNTVISEMRFQLTSSLKNQDINFLTAAYYLTRKHEFN